MKKLTLLSAVSGFALIVAGCGSATLSATPATADVQAASAQVAEATATPAPATESVTESAVGSGATMAVSEQATEASVEATAAETPAGAATEVAFTAVAANTKLNLNTVTADELMSTIPGFSNRMVREFQEYRPYVSIQQFRREIGKYVDEANVAGYEEYE